MRGSPTLWRSCRLPHGCLLSLARDGARGGRRDHPRPARMNDASRETIRNTFRLTRNLAPQRPFERPAWNFPGFAAWPPRIRFSTPFHPAAASNGPPGWVRPPSTCSAANGDHASLSLGVACRLLQPDTTRGHTLRAFDPRTRVELSLRCSPAPTDAGCVGLSPSVAG